MEALLLPVMVLFQHVFKQNEAVPCGVLCLFEWCSIDLKEKNEQKAVHG